MGALGGGSVLLDAGDYFIETDHLRFQTGKHDHVRLQGAGVTTVLRLKAGLARSAILVGSDAQDMSVACSPIDADHAVMGVQIDALRIVGNLGNPLDCCPISSAAWVACETYAAGSNLTRNGITVRCASDVQITNVAIENTNSGGIVVDHAHNLLVDGAQIDKPLVDCFASNFTDGTVVRNVTCNSPGWAGLNADPATHLTLQGNTVKGSGSLYRCPDATTWEMPGFYLAGVTDSTITGNVIVDSSGVGIELKGASRNIVSGNHIENSTKVGIVLDVSGSGCVNGSIDNLLSGNVIVNGLDYPLWGVCPSSGNIASANICSGNAHPGPVVTSNPDCGTTCADTSTVIKVTDGTCGG
jgi:parallel beta-helix repeat protein